MVCLGKTAGRAGRQDLELAPQLVSGKALEDMAPVLRLGIEPSRAVWGTSERGEVEAGRR